MTAPENQAPQSEHRSEHRSEKPNPGVKFKRYDFKPEGYVHVDDIEFLNEFLSFLYVNKLNPEEFIFRGMDASRMVKRKRVFERPPAVFGMNETAWKVQAEKSFGETTPGGYTKFAEQPAIALYDALQLAQAIEYKVETDPEDPTSIVEISDIKPGLPLIKLDLVAPLSEVFTHKDFPENPDVSPTDALFGIVYLED